MDSLSEATDRRMAVRANLEAARSQMQQAASAANFKGDPAAPIMESFVGALDALGAIYEASAETQIEIVDRLRQGADEVAEEAIERVHSSGVSMIDQLAPRLAVVVERTTRAKLQALRMRTVLGGTAAIIVGVGLVFGFSYSTGYASGRTQGEVIAKTIAAAMDTGPGAAAAWSTLMANNDPVRALAVCKQSVSTDAHGRRYCAMPVWLDPPSVPDGK
jgi:hypothetical protein